MVESKGDNWQECPQFYKCILHSSEFGVTADQPDFESVARGRIENLIGYSLVLNTRRVVLKDMLYFFLKP